MGKQSRRERKHLRVKRERAEVHGLPVAPAPVGKPLADLRRAQSQAARGESNDLDAVDGVPGKSPQRGYGWSSWPLSVKLVLAGIAVLIIFGLYRRYTEDSRKASDLPSTSADSHGR